MKAPFANILRFSAEESVFTTHQQEFQQIAADVNAKYGDDDVLFRPEYSSLEQGIRHESADIIFRNAAAFFNWLGLTSEDDVQALRKQTYTERETP